MGLVVGDFTDDGYPDVVAGLWDPNHPMAPAVLCSVGDGLGFERCHRTLGFGEDLRFSHGSAVADLDHDGGSDLFLNLGGQARQEGEAGQDSVVDQRLSPVLFVQAAPGPARTAHLRLTGIRSNRDAIGVRIVVEGEQTHYLTVRGSQGFRSQNSPWQPLALGAAEKGAVRIEWPSGERTTLTILAGDRLWVDEDGLQRAFP